MDFGSTGFWLALLEIIWVNILLSGDNAVVIALAARTLPPSKQFTAIAVGSGVAIALRIGLTLIAAQLLLLPWLKVAGGVLLLYIGIKLLLPEGDSAHAAAAKEHSSVWSAIRTILVADLIMSLDNVLGVAAAAHDSLLLLTLGLAISIPLVIFGSTVLLKLTERFPAIVWAGGAVLGFVAGEMLTGDPAMAGFVAKATAAAGLSAGTITLAAGLAGALIVLLAGKLILWVGHHRHRVHCQAANGS